MSAITASQVKLLTNEVACQRVSAALDTSYFTTPLHGQVLLVQAGGYYMAYPVGVHAGEFGILAILDSAFNFLAATTT